MEPLVRFKLMRPGAQLPQRGTNGSGGFDLFAPEDGHLDIFEKRLIPSGIAHELPPPFRFTLTQEQVDAGWAATAGAAFKLQGVLFDRSGLGGKKGIRLSFACLIDNDYRGEIFLSIENQSGKPFDWKAGDRLVQITYVLMYSGDAGLAAVLSETARGEGGFGSTGR